MLPSPLDIAYSDDIRETLNRAEIKYEYNHDQSATWGIEVRETLTIRIYVARLSSLTQIL